MSLFGLPDWDKPLRDWQQSAFEKWAERPTSPFLAVATPGAGKTIGALRNAHHALTSNLVRRVVVVCHTTYLKRQWAQTAAQCWIPLDYSFENGRVNGESIDFKGACLTYAQVGGNPGLHKRLTERIPTMVIFDEVHHAGDNLSWGDGVRDAFSGAVCKLLISGTPFRSDNNPIPFVSYVNNSSVADYSYSYADALRDGVCRSVVFPHYEGDMTWMVGFEVHNKRFSDPIAEREANHRLRTALIPTGEWMRQVLHDATAKLRELRRTHKDAGGLIVCTDKEHARKIAKVIERITGAYPTVVVSDDPNASANISAFAKGSSEWIVAVRMVSEGIDIRRLRVLVYATPITTELYFRQFVGRGVRFIFGLDCDQTCYVYIPSDDRLKAFAQEIKEERNHVLREIEESTDRAKRDGKGCGGWNPFEPMVSENAQEVGIVTEHGEFPSMEIRNAQEIADKLGMDYPLHHIARIVRAVGAAPSPEPEPARTVYTINNTVSEPSEVLLRDEVSALSKQVAKQVWYAVNLMGKKGDNEAYKLMGYELREKTDGRAEQKDCTLAELKRRYEYMEQRIKELKRGY